jgi:hypothetical protein
VVATLSQALQPPLAAATLYHTVPVGQFNAKGVTWHWRPDSVLAAAHHVQQGVVVHTLKGLTQRPQLPQHYTKAVRILQIQGSGATNVRRRRPGADVSSAATVNSL